MRGFVTSITDIHTFVVSTGLIIRLEGVDAADVDTEKAEHLKARLTDLILKKRIRFKEQARNSYGVVIAQVWAGDNNINTAMNGYIKQAVFSY